MAKSGHQILNPQLHIAGCSEVPIERQRLADTQRAHYVKARGIDEGVLAPMMPAEPFERPLFGLQADLGKPDPWRSFEHVKEQHGRTVPSSAPEERPGFRADVIGRNKLAASMASEQRRSFALAAIASVMERYPERSINEDHR